MATFNFYLKDIHSSKETSVFLYLRWKNKLLKQYIGESINPKHWDSAIQRAKKSKQFPEYPEFNHRLDSVLQVSKGSYRQFLNDNEQRHPSINEMKVNLRFALNVDEHKKVDFKTFFQRFIEENRSNKVERVSKYYQETLNKIKAYELKVKVKIDFDSIDMKFYHGFLTYLREIGLADNTIGKHIQNLKAVLHEAEARSEELGIKVNSAFRLKGFKRLSEESMNIYLDESELDTMRRIDLSGNERLERVRDLFLVGCWTGLRYSDFSKIRKENIQGGFLNIKAEKTGKPIQIPLHPIVKEILVKYKRHENSLPPAISDQKMRDYLKEIGKLIPGLHDYVLKPITKGGEKITMKKMKFEMIGTHTARRSFATNQYNSGLDTLTIMAITGHKTEKAFLTYIKTTPKEHAIRLKDHWEKNDKLKVI